LPGIILDLLAGVPMGEREHVDKNKKALMAENLFSAVLPVVPH
jgi:hypothetical protein